MSANRPAYHYLMMRQNLDHDQRISLLISKTKFSLLSFGCLPSAQFLDFLYGFDR